MDWICFGFLCEKCRLGHQGLVSHSCELSVKGEKGSAFTTGIGEIGFILTLLHQLFQLIRQSGKGLGELLMSLELDLLWELDLDASPPLSFLGCFLSFFLSFPGSGLVQAHEGCPMLPQLLQVLSRQ